MNDIVVEIAGLVHSDIKFQIKKELTISQDLDGEVSKTAAQFGYYAVLAEKAKTRVDGAKMTFDVWCAKQRKEITKEHGKFKTVAEMDMHMLDNPKYLAFKNRLKDLDNDARILKQVAKAFEIKKDLVQTSNANRRNEEN